MATTKRAIPIELYIDNGRHKKSKAYIEARKQAQKDMVLGTKVFSMPPILKGDMIAMGKWVELVDLFSDYNYVTDADTDIMAQYCLCFSEICELLHDKRTTKKFLQDHGTADIAITNELQKMKFDANINSKRDKLTKLADTLFLTPTARIRATVKPEKPKQDPLSAAGFGDI